MSMKFREELNTVGFFYIMTAIYWLAIGIMGAYWVLYFAGLGLAYSAIALIFLMHPISSLIFEIPTGAIADIFGRKTSVFLSYLITGLAFMGVLLSGTNLSLLVFFYFIAGFSFTLESGALESWFVDTVKHKKKSRYLHRLFGRWGSVGSAGFVIGPFVGGLLVTFGVDKAFWATAVMMLLLSLFVLIWGREEYFKKGRGRIMDGFKESFKTGKEGFKHTFKQPVILTLGLIMALMSFAVAGIFHNAYQPYVVEAGLPLQFLGFALSAAGLISVFSLNYSHKITKSLGGNKKSLLVFTLLVGLAILGVAFAKYLPLLFLSMIAVTAFAEFAGNTAPAFRELFNRFVPSRIRATVLSVNSLNMRVGEIFGLVAFGLISDHLGLQAGIVLAGILVMLIAFLYLRIRKI